jgi:hypothetical protein
MLEISILGPVPLLLRQSLAVIGRSIHFALQKHTLPKTGLFQIAFMGFHLFSPFTKRESSSHHALNLALRQRLMPLGN